jgi:hypothetical protein
MKGTGFRSAPLTPAADGLFRFGRLQAVNQEGCALAWQHLLGVGLVGTVLLSDLFSSAFFCRLAIFGSDGFGIDEFLGDALRRQDWPGRERQTK